MDFAAIRDVTNLFFGIAQTLMNRFLIVGPPGMGKSTLLANLPSIVLRATCIDLENTTEPQNPEFLRNFASSILEGDWRYPLFFGNAAADACQLTKLGLGVIALHCSDRNRYLEQMNARDKQYRQSSQGDSHWAFHRKLFEEDMPSQNIHPFILDSVTMGLEETIHTIASRFDLKLWTNRVVWITGPRGAGKTTTGMAFSRVACSVDTDGLLGALNDIVPRQFRYEQHQSTHGFKAIPESEFKGYLREAWGRVSKSPRKNCPLVVAGWHVREPWLRSVILDTFAKGQKVVEHLHLIRPSLDEMLSNIRKRNNSSEIETYCSEAGVELLKQSIVEFDKLCCGWTVQANSTELLKTIECETGLVPETPKDWR